MEELAKKGYAENDDQSRKYPLDKMEQRKKSSDEQKQITRIMEINTVDTEILMTLSNSY